MTLATQLSSLATRIASEVKAVRGVANTKVASTLVGAANGVAQLGADGKVPTSQLPAQVTSIATTSANGLMSSTDKSKLDGVATGANNYSHPTGDGNLHVPATSTTNSGKVLMAGATAGTLSWAALATVATSGSYTDLTSKPTLGTAAAAATSDFAAASHVGAGGTAHAVATTSVAGFLSASDKTRLDKTLVNDAIAPIKGYTLTRSALGNITGTATLNLSNGNVFTATVTGAVTLSVSGAPATGSMGELQIVLTDGGSATVTWPSSFKWPGGTAPTLTASGVDVIVATTVDGGTTWLASHAMKDVK